MRRYNCQYYFDGDQTYTLGNWGDSITVMEIANMDELNLIHSNGNKVKLTTPDTLSGDRSFKLPGNDGSSGESHCY